MTPTLVVTLKADAARRAVIESTIGSTARVIYLADVLPKERSAVLAQASVLLAYNSAEDLQPGEAALLGSVRLIQFITAGVDYIPLADLPVGVPVASNGGAYAEPMAEHALAMALAALKRLFVEHAKLAAGTFDQFRGNRMLAGSVCGILGFGGIGVATARLMRGLGVRVHAINRGGTTTEPVDWIGRNSDLDQLLSSSDILILSLPLTPATKGLLAKRELALMKRDAILINLARGEILDETALFAHLRATPEFTACIDAWWTEPVRHGRFAMDHAFTSLPNVIASPHNSASVVGWRDVALRRAVENARCALEGGEPRHLVPPSDRMM
ncbi:MAG: hydroxyacid dehydrogenase [Hyphomicrobiaceae bacterium]|nr:MAG: hydroxyacid dehydrogenase [Hyphomicrobiaceae bacterium]